MLGFYSPMVSNYKESCEFYNLETRLLQASIFNENVYFYQRGCFYQCGSPDARTRIEIDYVSVDKRRRICITNIRSYRRGLCHQSYCVLEYLVFKAR